MARLYSHYIRVHRYIYLSVVWKANRIVNNTKPERQVRNMACLYIAAIFGWCIYLLQIHLLDVRQRNVHFMHIRSIRILLYCRIKVGVVNIIVAMCKLAFNVVQITIYMNLFLRSKCNAHIRQV